jgi:oxalate decarboxylase/phosphoglucose isomerase-like protein (cupin superfamily)
MKQLNNYFSHEDNRGIINGITNIGEWKEINLITSLKGSIRGNHYHKHTTELIYIISGEAELMWHKKDGEINSIQLHKNDCIIIETGEFHRVLAKQDTLWINALSIPMDPDNPDIHQ